MRDYQTRFKHIYMQFEEETHKIWEHRIKVKVKPWNTNQKESNARQTLPNSKEAVVMPGEIAETAVLFFLAVELSVLMAAQLETALPNLSCR